jgi:hypothetical protein
MMLIDTNVFLEVFLNQERADEASRLLQRVDTGGVTAYVTDFAIHSVAFTLDRRGQRNALPTWLAYLANTANLDLVRASLQEQVHIAELALQTGLDFDDAYQVYFARLLGVPIVSYDRDFDGVVERKTPSEVV